MEVLKEFFDHKKTETNPALEQLIAKHLYSFVHEKKLFNLNIAVLHRISSMFLLMHPGIDLLPLINFFLDALESYGEDGSVLFSIIPVTPHEDYMMDQLLNRYPRFSVLFLGKEHVEYLFNKMRRLEAENKELKELLHK